MTDFYEQHHPVVINMLETLVRDTAIPCRIFKNDSFKYVILLINPYPFSEYRFTVAMAGEQFAILYKDENYDKHEIVVDQLDELQAQLERLKPTIRAGYDAIMTAWQEMFDELDNN